MGKEILINSTNQETRIAMLQDKKVAELFFERASDKGIVGNIYKGRVVRVLPGMQAAFVDIGHERAAFLYAGDFHYSKHNAKDFENDNDGRGNRNKNGRGRNGRRLRQEEVPPIASLVREGQEILVQVAKGPLGTKGARLTCHISLPGRFLVFMPTLSHNGVSRKIEDYKERKILKRLIDSHHPKQGGYIVRTAASRNDPKKMIKNDVDYLWNLWEKIDRKFKSSGSPKLLHYDLDITTRVIRDFLDEDIERLTIDSRAEHRRVLRFIRHFNPELRSKVDLYDGTSPLFDKYNVETEINKALGKRVWLKSGGYLIVETTEALTSIDVNTGRFVGKKTLEETILRTNLEAAEEIVRQLRLRNIGGIIIIDFIDMEKDSSKEQVYRYLETLVQDDKSRTTILKISNLGLVEMTRKRSREPLLRYLTETCPTCEGRGHIKSKIALAHQALRDIRREIPNIASDYLYVTLHPEILEILERAEKNAVTLLEKQYQKGIRLSGDVTFHIEQIALSQEEEKPEGANARPSPVLQDDDRSRPVSAIEEDDEDDLEEYEADLRAIEEERARRANAATETPPTAGFNLQEEDEDDDEDDAELEASDDLEEDDDIAEEEDYLEEQNEDAGWDDDKTQVYSAEEQERTSTAIAVNDSRSTGEDDEAQPERTTKTKS